MAPAEELGKATVGWVLLAPVPQDISTVDVLVGSALVQSVPVEDGLLEPVSDEAAPAVGTGWPAVDTTRLSDVVRAKGAVFDLRSQVKDVKKKVTKATRKGGEEIDLDTSVLFATDKATLTSRARGVIAEAARQITAAGSSGSITVTGHTDSNASDAYNLDLSKRRAAAVARALEPRLPGGISIRSVGKGESEPIADNSTAAGRALNRRVTITLPK
ncbi:OmpA family protein [Phycicoccus sp. CMS6Z-2]|nr:OmpA family protein [Phycicoccus flavus]